ARRPLRSVQTPDRQPVRSLRVDPLERREECRAIERLHDPPPPLPSISHALSIRNCRRWDHRRQPPPLPRATERSTIRGKTVRARREGEGMSSNDKMAAVDRYIEEHLAETIADLGHLCAFPSVGAQAQAMDETAEATRALLEKYGVNARVMPSDGFPMVYGDLQGASPKTVLCYNHYDVQPAEPFELWDAPPFEMTERDGKLFARGVGDDKGHIVCRLAAIAALKAVYGEVPCSVKFLIEGEEEIGS